jgi:hypothetical protein
MAAALARVLRLLPDSMTGEKVFLSGCLLGTSAESQAFFLLCEAARGLPCAPGS